MDVNNAQNKSLNKGKIEFMKLWRPVQITTLNKFPKISCDGKML